ncbi:MAG TPA: hypothetical protein VMW82_02510 [Candidatus Paceibacterota bacterium]|nr:hypothetical protein [Candidatus Paceibacterota bacterium]
MILLPHIITGAVIGAKTQNFGLIIILGFLIHFIMDRIPHWDYSIKGVQDFRKTRNFKKLIITLIKIGIDGLIGLLIVFLTLWQKEQLNFNYLLFVLFGIFVSVLPDIIFAFFILFMPTHLLKNYLDFHYKYLHLKKEGGITFLGLSAQIAVIIFVLVVFFL